MDRDGGENEEKDSEEDYKEWCGIVERNGGENEEKDPEKAATEEGRGGGVQLTPEAEVCFILNYTGSY